MSMNPDAETLRAAIATPGPSTPLDLPPGTAPMLPMGTAGLPEKSEALYALPNENGERKKCGNCWKFVRGAPSACLEMAREEEVVEAGVCGVHAPGEPMEQWPDILPANRQPYTKDDLGYVVPVDGASCDRCVHYEAAGTVVGYCHALSYRGMTPAPVEALGCCARFVENALQPAEGNDAVSR